jgi:hypothetical protein
MPRKTETIATYYRGITAEGEVIKESASRKTVARYMRHHPAGTIETRQLVGYYTPWAPATAEPQPKPDETKEDDQ